MGLKCANPRCKSNNLHQYAVEIFHRKEDAEEGLHILVENFEVVQDTILKGNPSQRRSGLVIKFWCENCSTISEVIYRQHKGDTEYGIRESKIVNDSDKKLLV